MLSADNDHVWLGDPLQARRKIRRLANHAALLRLPRRDEMTNHDQAGCHSDRVCRKARVLSAVTAVINSSPARMARSASSSWAWG